jgi:hypothetical protein
MRDAPLQVGGRVQSETHALEQMEYGHMRGKVALRFA